MKRFALAWLAATTFAASVAFGDPAGAQPEPLAPAASVDQFASVFTPDARRGLATTQSDQFLSVVVRLDDQVNLAEVLAAADVVDGYAEDAAEGVIRSLQETAARDQFLFRILAPIWESGPDVEEFTPFWIMNGFAITATPGVIASIARYPEVAEIDIDRKYGIAGLPPSGAPNANVASVGAPEVWAQGHTGEGVVVAVLDTGVDMVGIPGVFASEVANSYRGGASSWFDPYTSSTEPYDLTGHGTAVASIITGRDQSGATVGVAPDTQWIAAKIFDDSGVATTSAIHAAFEWALDPDGNPSTDDGADVVNASWTSGAPGCDTEFAPDIAALRAAGVIPVFAAGNYGPQAASAPSPSNLPGVLAVGAVRADLTVVLESSRGPTECGGATRTFPHIVAPGDGVVAQSIQGQYIPHTGTSFAAPHVAGAVALLIGASPASTDAEIEAALVGSAVDLGIAGTDDVFGAGLLDVGRALELLGGVAPDPSGTLSGVVFGDLDADGLLGADEVPTGSVQVTVFAAGDDATLGTADDFIAAEAVTDPAGTWLISGLVPGSYRVAVATTSLPLAAILTTPAIEDVALNDGDIISVLFGWRPPDPGSVLVNVFDDIDGDGQRDPAEPGLVGVSVTVEAAGADGDFGTPDDAPPFVGLTDASGALDASGLPPGPARVTVDPATLPERGYVSGISGSSLVVTTADVTTIAIGVHVPSRGTPLLHVSLKRAGRANDGNLAYRDEDILTWNGSRLEMLFDGSDVGLAGRDVDAFHVIDDDTLLLSLDRSLEIEGLGLVEDSDVLLFEAEQLGSSTRGEFSIYLDGSSVGLVGRAADIDAISMIGGSLLVSIRGSIDVDGLQLRDEDMLEIDVTDGIASVSVFVDGSAVGLTDRVEDIDAAAFGPSDLLVSTLGPISIGSLSASDGDLVSCDSYPSCTWRVATQASALGLAGSDLDGISLPTGREES